jgi:pimeloyl-ACP methyl ester carboxylesterase
MAAAAEDRASWRWGIEVLRKAGAEVAALARMGSALPLRPLLPRARFDAGARHRTPVVFVHGFLGDPSNFVSLQGYLHGRGVRNWSTFGYGPRVDYPRVAARLLETIEGVRRETGAPQVDLVGHSLGGLVGRHLIEIGHGAQVRRLVTLGAPWFAHPSPPQELSIFGDDDVLVPPPPSDPVARRRMLVVRGCGHVGLLFHPHAQRGVAGFLTRPALAPAPRALAA